MKKVLYVVEDTKSAQFRYRVENVIEALNKSSDWRGSYVLTENISNEDLNGVDLLVVLRQTAKNKKILNLIKKAQEQKIKVLFDLDDLIFDYKDLVSLMSATNSKNVVYWFGYIWGIRKIAKKVDGFIATNDFLANKLKRSFKRAVRVIPNSLNSKQLEVAKESLDKKEHKGFLIGYFSGSPTHAKDLKAVEPEIFRFLDAHKDAKLKIVGYVEPSFEMKKRIQNGQVEVSGFVDYLEQMKKVSKMDVNIAPLVVNEFTNCKSELKFFEAAVVETTTIASPSYAFKKAISDFQTGFLAKPGEWYEKLEYLYENTDQNQKIAKRAREYALKYYYGKEFLECVEKAYTI